VSADTLPWRTIQVGLGGPAADRYVHEWITALTDITATVHKLHELINAGDEAAARRLIPAEQPYPLPPGAATAIGATDT
jgi:hypothetical protein